MHFAEKQYMVLMDTKKDLQRQDGTISQLK